MGVTPLRPNLLCVVPPYVAPVPPLGAASLLGYLKANGCDDFDFLDLRHYSSHAYAPTYRPSGVFGETYVIDVPDLPLVLRLLDAFDRRAPFIVDADPIFETYCLERGINPSYLQRYLHQLDCFLSDCFDQLPNIAFIGFTTWSSNMLTTLMAAAHLKRRRRPPFIVLGGPQVTESRNSAKLALESGLADAIALGEGEETLLTLYETVRAGGSIASVPGALVRAGDGTFVATERKLMRLATKPLPDFSGMAILDYQAHGLPLTLLPYELSRGCTDKCTFCSEWVFWKHFRIDSVDHVISDIKALAATYPIQGLWFADSLLNGVKARLVGFAEALLSEGVRLKWGGFMRADMDAQTAQLITRAGCELAFLGVESLSDETLELMKKRRTAAQNLEAITALLDAGISRVVAGVIPGFPGDTRARFMGTALRLREIQMQFPDRFRVNVEPFIVSPGQPLFSQMDKVGLVPAQWPDEIIDLAPKYSRISAEILCSVSGANQGIDRLGQLRIATTINSIDKVQTQDPFLYSTSEDVSDSQFLAVSITRDLMLARFKTQRGLRCGLLITEAEWRESNADLGSSGLVRMSSDAFHQLVERIAARHVIAPPRSQARVQRRSSLSGSVPEAVPDDTLVVLSPAAVCRHLPDTPVAESLLVNVVNPGLHVRLPAVLCGLLERLVGEPLSWGDVRGECETLVGPLAAAQVLALLVGRGFLEHCRGAAAETPLTQLVNSN